MAKSEIWVILNPLHTTHIFKKKKHKKQLFTVFTKIIILSIYHITVINFNLHSLDCQNNPVR